VNLTEIRNKIKSITDYSPELATYNEQLDLLINDAYNAIWTEKRWRFAQKVMFMDIWPDVLPLQPDGTTKNAGVTNNRRRVTFSGAVRALESYPYVWEGQIIEIQGRDYFIDQVISGTDIRLREPFRGTTNVDDTTWKIKHRFYDLPPDAIEILGLMHKDTPAAGKIPPYGAVRGITARREEDLNLREDFTNFYSQAYIPYGTSNVPPAENISYTVEGATGTIPSGTYLEFCWAFETDGGKKVGALSNSVIAKAGTVQGLPSGISLKFTTWDDIAVQAPVYADTTDQIMNQFEGLRKRIYFNQNFNRATGQRLGGLPVWREVTIGSTYVGPGIPGLSTETDPVRVADTVSTYTVASLDQVNPGSNRYIDYDGLHLRFRPYPRPIGSDFVYLFVAGSGPANPVNSATERQFRQWELRYYRKPSRLGLQTDTPEFPIEFHQLVVYKVLHDIYSKHDNLSQAQNYQRKYDEEIKRLERRYVDSIDTNLIRQQFGIRGRIWTPFDPSSLRRLN
jgi:hypothetical protein